MEHSIVITKHRKVPINGKYGYMLVTRYKLTEDEICEQELKKHLEDVGDTDVWEYDAAIEETKH